MRIFGEKIKQLLFPLRCPVCDEAVKPSGQKICPACRKKLKRITSPFCMKCGKKLAEDESFCSDCKRGTHIFKRGRALYEYESVSGAVFRMKYAGRREYADFFGEEAAFYLGDFLENANPDGLIPIPLHKKRFRARGYNQAGELADAVGKYAGLPVFDKILLRRKNTVPLKLLNPKERQNNLKKAFIIAQNDVKLKTVILIDDIYTTGSTVDEAARTLMEAGVRNVYFIALSCGAGV